MAYRAIEFGFGAFPVCDQVVPWGKRRTRGVPLLLGHGPRQDRCPGGGQPGKPWIEAAHLPSWAEMSDLDKGAALMHVWKRKREGGIYARENFLHLPAARATHGPVAGLAVHDDPIPGKPHILNLPRWDTAWEVKTGRGGWPKVDPKTGKVIKTRRVWDALHGNSRPAHYAARHKAVKEVITAVVNAATTAGLTPCRHLTVQLVWAPGDNRRADRGNLQPIQKALIDGLVRGPRKDLPGLHLVPDDSDRWVEELMPRIDRPPAAPGLWLEVWPR